MNKKKFIIIIAVILIIALGAGGYVLWSKMKKTPLEKALEAAGDTTEKSIDNATRGVLPSIQTNPLENKPDINPADKANPYKNIKTNPFE